MDVETSSEIKRPKLMENEDETDEVIGPQPVTEQEYTSQPKKKRNGTYYTSIVYMLN